MAALCDLDLVVRKKKILCTAQAFGFGPISKLFSVARYLNRYFSLHILSGERENVFLRLNPGVFLDAGKATDFRQAQEAISRIRPDAVLSTYDYNLVIAGARMGIPSYFIDGLFWFWKLGADIEELKVKSIRTTTKGEVDSEKTLSGLDPHERIFLSHFIATRSFIQNDPCIDYRLSALSGHVRTSTVGAIIENYSAAKETVKDHVLVSLSGQVFPGINDEQSASYARIVLAMMDSVARKYFVDYKWVALINPDVRRALLAGGNITTAKLEVLDSVGQEKMRELQDRSVVMFSSPGMTTIYECASRMTPLIFLPEQSTQYENAYRLEKYGYPVLGCFFRQIFDCSGAGKDGLGLIYEKIIPNIGGAAKIIEGKLSESCGMVSTDISRGVISTSQRQAVLKMVGNFDGARQIADRIRKDLSGAEN